MSASGTYASSNVLTASGPFDPQAELTELHLADGRVVRLPTALLTADISAAPFAQETGSSDPLTAVRSSGDDTMIVPVLEERLEVGKRVVPTGKVRLHKTVHEFETALNEPLTVRTYNVERVPVNQLVETAPAVRIEGQTTIYPLLEEQLVLTKQLVLLEEVRVTEQITERRDTQVVTLRRESINIEREPV